MAEGPFSWEGQMIACTPCEDNPLHMCAKPVMRCAYPVGQAWPNISCEEGHRYVEGLEAFPQELLISV